MQLGLNLFNEKCLKLTSETDYVIRYPGVEILIFAFIIQFP